MRRTTTDEDIARVLDMHRAGASNHVIERETGVNRKAVGRLVRQHGNPAPLNRGHLTGEERKSIAYGYRRGATIAELAERRGVSHKAVETALKREGVEMRPRGNRVGRMTKATFLERIFAHIEIVEGCWEWHGGWKRTRKTARIAWVEKAGRGYAVARFLYEHAYGSLGDDRLNAGCPNGRCVNPDHRIVRPADPWHRALNRLTVDTDTFCWVVQVGDRKARLGTSDDGYAHRRAWQEWVGPIPEGREIWRRCKNLRCINPDHMFLLPRHGDRFEWQGEEEPADDLTCGRGHLMIGDAVRIVCPNPGEAHRRCLVCRREDDKRLMETIPDEEPMNPRERFRQMRELQRQGAA